MSSTVVEKKMKYHLKVYVNHTSYERDEEDKCKRLVEKYQEAISKHNDMVFQNNFPDSGFDIYVPFKTLVNKTKTTKINMNIVAVMYDTENNRAVGYTMYPRSSISKTVLRLANNVGIIDSGYRGNLMGVFDCVSNTDDEHYIEEHHRLLQICHPTLEPFTVELVDNIAKFKKTSRGSGGFGSSGAY